MKVSFQRYRESSAKVDSKSEAGIVGVERKSTALYRETSMVFGRETSFFYGENA